MNFLVIEGLDGAALNRYGKFCIAQGIIDTSCFCVLIDAFSCGSIELLAVWSECQVGCLIQSGFSYLNESFVGLVSDGEDVDELRL